MSADHDKTEPIVGGGRVTGRQTMDFVRGLVERDDVTGLLAFLGRVCEAAACDYPPPQPVFGPRSSGWPAARREHVKHHPACAACGQRDHVEVHHIEPYHLRPDLELVPSNLVTLCDRPGRSCHFSLGHLWDWHRANPLVREVCSTLYGQLQEALRADG